jgi:hypothetical protein
MRPIQTELANLRFALENSPPSTNGAYVRGFLDGLTYVDEWIHALERRLKRPGPFVTGGGPVLLPDTGTISTHLAEALLQLLDYFREQNLTGRCEVALFMGRLAGLLACLAYSSQEHKGLLEQSGQDFFLA